jgi:hypothetical protein
MLICNMASNLHLYVIQNNYKCDSPNSPPIHVFTLLMTSESNWMPSTNNQRIRCKNIIKGWISFFKEDKFKMQDSVVDSWPR